MKIAICLHGESRTWQKCVNSIRNFVQKEGDHEIHYFGHTWSQNSWRTFDKIYQHGYIFEDLNRDNLLAELNIAYPFDNIVVDPPYIQSPINSYEMNLDNQISSESAANYKLPTAWLPMAYSSMVANFKKQQYEIEHDVTFDVVVSIRWDDYFNDNYSLNSVIPSNLNDDFLYSHVSIFPREYRFPCVHDIFYFGSSRVMDTICSFYRTYHNGNFFKLVDANYYDGAYKLVGYGCLLYKWATIKNIYVQNINHQQMGVVRRNTSISGNTNEYNIIEQEMLKWGIPDE